MLIPWNTDAPIYHWPFATVGLIVVNALVWLLGPAVDLTEAAAPAGTLVYGEFNPLQWISSNFMHAGIVHLIGNMVFLWAFGIVVEGKLGWWKFLIVFLAIGFVQCGIEQTAAFFTGQPGFSLGASAIVYGLIGMAVVWAPKNEVSCVYYLTPRLAGSVDIPIFVLGIIYLAQEILLVVLAMMILEAEGFVMTGSVLHLMGAGLGFGAGIAMLTLRWVDCENWDMFTVWRGRAGESPEERKRSKETPEQRQQRLELEQQQRRERVVALIAQGEPLRAYHLYQQLTAGPGQAWEFTREELVELIKGLHRDRLWDASLPLMVEHLRRFPAESGPMRLRLAQVLIRHYRRPVQALKVLAKIPPGSLPPKLQPKREELAAQAQQLQEQGVAMELETEDW